MNPPLPPLSSIHELRRQPSPLPSPQALACRAGELWVSSRDSPRLNRINPETWAVLEEMATPAILWAAVPVGEFIYFTSGEGEQDDRYLRRCTPGRGFDDSYHVALPNFTGSYLSHDGGNLFVSQWYKHRVLQLDPAGGVVRSIDIGAEISGHAFVDGVLYVLRGTEQDGESWQLARLHPGEQTLRVEDLARVPFACRSLAYDGTNFWTNHRAADEIVSFALPGR